MKFYFSADKDHSYLALIIHLTLELYRFEANPIARTIIIPDQMEFDKDKLNQKIINEYGGEVQD